MFFEQFGLLFTNMDWFVIVLFLVGVICLFTEFLQPGFGVFGISGIISLVLSIILRAVFHQPEDNVVMQIFQFLLVDTAILGMSFLALFIAQKKGWMKRGIFTVGTAVDPKHSQGTEDFRFLVGQRGKTVTVLRPAGKAEIDGKTFDVVSEDFLIEEGEDIVVTSTEGGEIRVKKD